MNSPLAAWHQAISAKDATALDTLLADNAVFHSPVVHSPQVGKDVTKMYLSAAFHVLANDSFHYVREVVDGQNAVLEFVVEVDGVTVNGVDMIHWDENGKIADFKVMLRPYKAINLIKDKMRAMLESL
ncbi:MULTISPECIES: nuclear transport factor 2 family protein [Zhongshania]|jgi:ketosteroid isomerase-like protein|uniref:Ketosteroid isomerase-like protein n=1 Tax=Zhongshania antarctica TaxID=641702 RepID=A0A840R8Z6_9GAMM|nr:MULTISPECIES: nuclear transport factor 2 family protein [Zhongshania]MBB5188913.1 ketosteroid isomerase-like protein [Zhongshania antarctica]